MQPPSVLRSAACALLCLALLAAGGTAAAQQSLVTFLGLRTRPGVASDWLVAEAGRVIEQRLAGQPGVVLIPAAQVAQAVGSPLALASCQEDGCMALFAQTVGAQQVVWGYLDRPWPTGFRVWLRTLDLPGGSLRRDAQPACNPCDEAGLLGTLTTTSAVDMGFGAPPPAPPPAPPTQQAGAAGPAGTADAAGAAAAPAQPAAILQIPGVHRPLSPAEKQRAGWLTLASEPPGATLLLFSYKVGETPLRALQLLPGAYQAVLQLEGYQDQALPISVRTGLETRQLVRLAPSGILLRVVSLPIEAKVAVDGRPAGSTPLAAPLLTPGPHRIQLTLDGYLPAEQTVQAVAGKPVELTVALKAAPVQHGWLAVKTVPDRASVLVDDEPVGQSPIRKRELPVGEHRISAYLPGFAQQEQQVQLQGGQLARVTLKLEPARQNRTTVTVTSTPPGATAFLGDVRIGKTPLEQIKFKPGHHVLRLVLAGFPPYELPLTLKEGEETTHHADLKEGPPASGEGLLQDPLP